MLLPMEALAAPSGSFCWIDDVEYPVGDFDTWGENVYLGIECTADENGYAVWNGKWITLNGNPVLTTDYVGKSTSKIEGVNVYYTMDIPEPLDFTAPESISMRVTQGQSDLTIDPCVITNTGSEDLKLSQVEITAASGWTVVNASTDFTTADSKNKIAFTAGSHDFSSGAYTLNEKIAARGNTTLQLAGKISEKADLTNATQVASMVLTVEKVEIIAFKIGGGSYQAEEGMTWAEWVESSYNTDGYVIMGHTVYNEETGLAIGTTYINCVRPEDVIIAGYTYEHATSAGSGH